MSFFRILFDNSEQCLSSFHHLNQCISPVSRIEDHFAFAFNAWCMDERQSSVKDVVEFASSCQKGKLINNNNYY